MTQLNNRMFDPLNQDRRLIRVAIFVMSTLFLLTIRFSNVSFLLREDGVVEYLSAFIWLLGFVIAILEMTVYRNRRNLLLFALCLTCLVAFGEEISWCQRILDIQTPEFFVAENLQGETNLHNLALFSGGSDWQEFFRTGKFSAYQIFGAQNMFRCGFILLLLLVLPIVATSARIGKILEQLGYCRPELSFLLLVWSVIILSFLIKVGSPLSVQHEIQEAREFFFAIFVVSYLWYMSRRKRMSTQTTRAAPGTR